MSKLLPFLSLSAMALVPSTAMAQSTVAVPVPVIQGTRLDVVATGESRRVPDIAVISSGVVTQAPDAAGAMRENAGRMARVIAALKKAGIADRDITTSMVSLNPQYRYGENVPPVITGYQASNTLSVKYRDVKKSGAILDALVAEGANQISGPNLQLDKPEAAEDEARTDAIRKARARADLYAAAAGLKVKRILSISESGGYQPPVPQMVYARAEAKSADTAIMAGEQTVGITVSVSFELE